MRRLRFGTLRVRILAVRRMIFSASSATDSTEADSPSFDPTFSSNLLKILNTPIDRLELRPAILGTLR